MGREIERTGQFPKVILVKDSLIQISGFTLTSLLEVTEPDDFCYREFFEQFYPQFHLP
jgi:hypothetical protein